MAKLCGAGLYLLLIIAACSGSRTIPPTAHERAGSGSVKLDDDDAGRSISVRDAGRTSADAGARQRL